MINIYKFDWNPLKNTSFCCVNKAVKEIKNITRTLAFWPMTLKNTINVLNKLMKVIKNNLAKKYIFVISGYIIHFYTPVNIRAYYGIPLFVCSSTPRTITSLMAQLFILSYSDTVSFRDIRGHLGTISSIVAFYICACRRRRH